MSKLPVEGYRISPLQRRLWSLLSADVDSNYRAHVVVRLEGPLDTNRLKNAIGAVVSRHEALRTSFHSLPGISMPVQVVGESTFDFQEVMQEANDLGETHSLLEKIPAPSGPDTPTLLCKLVRIAEQNCALQIDISALCADGASLEIIVEQIRRAYQNPEQFEEAAAPLQYPDLAEWLDEISKTESTSLGRQYWGENISEVMKTLPVCGPGSGTFEFSPGILDVKLSKETAIRILDRNQTGSWKSSGLLLFAWALLLEQLGYETRSCVAVSCDGRADERLLNAVGPLTRYAPVNLKFDRNSSISEAAIAATRMIQEAAEWQEHFNWASFERGKHEAGMPYFPFSFEYTQARQHVSGQQEVRFTIEKLHAYADRSGLHLSCRADGEDLRIELHWDKQRHTTKEVERLADRLTDFLGCAAKRPESPLRELKVVSEAEREELIEAFNPPAVEFADYELLPEALAAQAERTPDAVAVRFEGNSLSYRELNEGAKRIEAYLRSRGAGPEVLVGICLERSLEMVAALLGVLKAGSAYIPLDPQYPNERLDFMVRDSKAGVVITRPEIAAKLTGCAAELVYVEAVCNRQVEDGSLTELAGENPAYVLYTSGSTGVPKGVMITHSGIRNHMAWMANEFPMLADDRVLQKTAFSFDASVWEFFAPLLAGSCLVMARPRGQQDREYLTQCIREEMITILQVVPSQLRMLIDGDDFQECRSLRLVFCGGEALTTELVKQFYDRLPEARLYNLYGPTEATIDTTVGLCSADERTPAAPLGLPISNVQVHVLNEHNDLVPVGVKGELHIGGAGLARGYLNRADLTAERFVPNPFSRAEGGRLYRTGDLGRWRDDRSLEFIGRKDHQVKLRGYRIELGEIESMLIGHEAVEQAVVVVRQDEPGDERLVAYLVLKRKITGGEKRELQRFLRKKMPEHLVPSVFVNLEELPLTPNGKVDRKSLPKPHQGWDEGGYIGPRDAEEEIFCGIFGEIFKQPRISINEDFFQMGGHSLLATQVMSRVQSVFEIEMPLRTLFESPTVAEMAERVKAARGSPKSVALPLVRVKREGELPLSYAQQRLWLIDQLDPDSVAYNMPFGLRLSGPLNRAALQRSLDELVRRHEVLRTSFPAPEGTPVQNIAAGLNLKLEEIDFQSMSEREREDEVSRRALGEANEPFDLSQGPLLRVKLFRLAEYEHALLVTMHHIISDGWSITVLVREVAQLYEAYANGEESPLPELAIQYADYAVWQRKWLRGETLRKQVDYWREQLAGVPILDLPTDRRRPPLKNYNGSIVSFDLSRELTAMLQEMSQREGLTLFMTLLAAFQVMLNKRTGQLDVAVGTGIANRNRLETEALIGFFVNTLVLRTRLEPEMRFRDLLKQVRHTTLEAYRHQDVPFEKLVQELHPERDPSRTPLFQTMFVLQNHAQASIEMSGLRVRTMQDKQAAVRSDMDLYMATSRELLTGTLVYDRELFEVSTIEGIVEQFKQLLASIVNRPDAALSELMYEEDVELPRTASAISEK